MTESASATAGAHDATVATEDNVEQLTDAQIQGFAVARSDAEKAVEAAKRSVIKAHDQVDAAEDALKQALADQKELG